MNDDAHDVLVVEDDPATAKRIADVVRTCGYKPRIATTVEEALAALREKQPRLLIVDQQLPADAHSPAEIGGGETVMAATRALDARRNANGWFVLPIIVLTGYRGDSDFVSRMYDAGAGAFVEKPLNDEKVEYLIAKMKLVMERAEQGTSTSQSPALRISIDGRCDGALTDVVVNGERRGVQDAVFLQLLRLVVAHQRKAGSWTGREVLGIGPSRSATTRLREPFKGLVPEGFKVLEADNRGAFRLNPKSVIERVDWKALEEHPNPGVQKMAREQRGRGSSRP